MLIQRAGPVVLLAIDGAGQIVEANSVVSSFRVHAIAPFSNCSEAGESTAYLDVAEASGGFFGFGRIK